MKRIVCIIGVIAIVFLLGIGLSVARELGVSLVAESAMNASEVYSAYCSSSVPGVHPASRSARVPGVYAVSRSVGAAV
ncbi:MAG: hypothetical protein IKC32_04240 [Clostridia bacterium]|nr:hypothetical protein [Clostridia bacterium]